MDQVTALTDQIVEVSEAICEARPVPAAGQPPAPEGEKGAPRSASSRPRGGGGRRDRTAGRRRGPVAGSRERAGGGGAGDPRRDAQAGRGAAGGPAHAGPRPSRAPRGLRERPPGRIHLLPGQDLDTVVGPVRLRRAWYHCAACKHGLAPRDGEPREMPRKDLPLPSGGNIRLSLTTSAHRCRHDLAGQRHARHQLPDI